MIDRNKLQRAAVGFNEAWEQPGDMAEFVRELSPEVLADFMLQIQVTVEPGDPEELVNKKLAVEVADMLGPDWAQAWYHFIVLVTKVA